MNIKHLMNYSKRIIYETGGASCAAMMRRGCAGVKMNKNGLNSTAGGACFPQPKIKTVSKI